MTPALGIGIALVAVSFAGGFSAGQAVGSWLTRRWYETHRPEVLGRWGILRPEWNGPKGPNRQ